MTIKQIVKDLEKDNQCCCDLDNWQPSKLSGHSTVCIIDKKLRRDFQRFEYLINKKPIPTTPMLDKSWHNNDDSSD